MVNHPQALVRVGDEQLIERTFRPVRGSIIDDDDFNIIQTMLIEVTQEVLNRSRNGTFFVVTWYDDVGQHGSGFIPQ